VKISKVGNPQDKTVTTHLIRMIRKNREKEEKNRLQCHAHLYPTEFYMHQTILIPSRKSKRL
jgi:hypothetical protein